MFERDFTKKIASVTEKVFAAPDFMLSNKKKKMTETLTGTLDYFKANI